MLNNTKTGNSTANELFFVESNGIRISYNYIRAQAEMSLNCSTDSANSVNQAKVIILYLGITILALSVAYVVFFVFTLSKKINELWTFLSTISFTNYLSLKGVYLNRLSMVNGVDEIDIMDFIHKEKPHAIQFKITFSQIWRYIWRILIFTALSVVFYLVVTLVYCSEIQQNITAHSNFIQIMNRNNNEIYLGFLYSSENYHKQSPLSLNSTFPDFIFLADPNVEFQRVYREYTKYKGYIGKKLYTQYLPSEIYLILFQEVTNDTYGFTRFGLRTGIQNIMHELEYISSTEQDGADELFFTVGYQMMDDFENISLIMDNQFKVLINQNFQSILACTVTYFIISILLYLCLYLPYLHKEGQHLCKIQSLARIVDSRDSKSTTGFNN